MTTRTERYLFASGDKDGLRDDGRRYFVVRKSRGARLWTALLAFLALTGCVPKTVYVYRAVPVAPAWCDAGVAVELEPGLWRCAAPLSGLKACEESATGCTLACGRDTKACVVDRTR